MDKLDPTLQFEHITDDPNIDITRASFGNVRYNQDKLLRSLGGNLDIYEDVYRDDRVKSCLQQRITAVTAKDYDVRAGGDAALDLAAAAAAKIMINSISFDHVTDKCLLQSLLKGWAVGEIVWSLKEGLIFPVAIKIKRSQRFVFAPSYLSQPVSHDYEDVRIALRPENSLRMRTRNNMITGEPLPDRKVFVHAIGALDDENPYGTGLGFWLYWPVRFKREGMSLWLQFIDKFGSPSAKGTYPAGADDGDKRLLLDALRALRSNSVTAIPEGMSVELIEAAKSGISTHEQLIERMDQAITTVILSQTLTTSQGQRGSQALGTVHETIKDEIAKADADGLSHTINATLMHWFTEFNFPGAKPPVVYRDMSEVEDLGNKAIRDKTIAEAAGKSLDAMYVEDEYNITLDKTPQPPTQTTNFAEAGISEDTPEQLAKKLADEASTASEAMVASIRTLLNDAQDLNEFAERLPELLGDMDTKAITEIMAKAMTTADLAGQYEVINA